MAGRTPEDAAASTIIFSGAIFNNPSKHRTERGERRLQLCLKVLDSKSSHIHKIYNANPVQIISDHSYTVQLLLSIQVQSCLSSLANGHVTCGLEPCINTILADTDKLIIKKCKGVVNNPRLVPS